MSYTSYMLHKLLVNKMWSSWQEVYMERTKALNKAKIHSFPKVACCSDRNYWGILIFWRVKSIAREKSTIMFTLSRFTWAAIDWTSTLSLRTGPEHIYEYRWSHLVNIWISHYASNIVTPKREHNCLSFSSNLNQYLLLLWSSLTPATSYSIFQHGSQVEGALSDSG